MNERTLAAEDGALQRRLAWAALGAGAALRVALCWANPTTNAFDDHFEPVAWVMAHWTVPPLSACVECHQPPVYYFTAALLGRAAAWAGLGWPGIEKLLQSLSCLYGVLTLWVVHRTLARLPLSATSRLLALATLCFLPRHIYVSSMLSNDTLSYLFVAVALHLAVVARDRRFPWQLQIATALATLAALLTKLSAMAILPALLLLEVPAWLGPARVRSRQAIAGLVVVLLLPAVTQAVFVGERYHSAFPSGWYLNAPDPRLHQPRDSQSLDLVGLDPLDGIPSPILAPRHLHSFWTLVYTGTWTDNEPKFLPFLGRDAGWWRAYDAWLAGAAPYPPAPPSISPLTEAIESGLLVLGFAPHLLVTVGLFLALRRIARGALGGDVSDATLIGGIVILLAANAAGILAQAIRMPVFSSMKASYFLTSMPTFALLQALGITWLESRPWARRAAVALHAALFGLVTAHVVHLVVSMA